MEVLSHRFQGFSYNLWGDAFLSSTSSLFLFLGPSLLLSKVGLKMGLPSLLLMSNFGLRPSMDQTCGLFGDGLF